MFDISWGKLVIIGVVALIFIGPKELPAVLRTVGQWMTKIRRMAAEFQGQFHEAMREAEMADLKKHVDDIADVTRNFGSGFDPIATAKTEIESAMESKPASAPSPAPATSGEPAAAAAAVSETAAPIEPELPLPEPAPQLTNKDIVGTAEPAPTMPAADAGSRPA